MPNSVLANSPRKQICKLNDHAVRSDDSTIKDDESSSPLLVEEIKKSQLDVDCSNTFKGQSGNNESTKIDTPYLQNSPVNKTRQEAKITGNVTYSPRKSSSKAIMAYRNPVAPMHSPRSIENTASTSISRKPPIVAPKSKPLKVLGAILKTGQPVVFDTPQSDLCKSQDTSLAAGKDTHSLEKSLANMYSDKLDEKYSKINNKIPSLFYKYILIDIYRMFYLQY